MSLIRATIIYIIAFFSPVFCCALSNKLNRELLDKVEVFILKEDNGNEDVNSLLKLKKNNQIQTVELYHLLQRYGTGLFYSGQQARAVEYYRLLLNYMSEAPARDKEDTAFLLNAYVCLGASLEELGMRNISMEYYMEGFEIAKDSDYKQYQAMLMNNIGVVYLSIGAGEKALRFFKDAIAINETLKKDKELFLNYNNVSAVYAKQNDYASALDNSLKALRYVDSNNDPVSYYSIHINLGILNSKKGNFPMAVTYLNNAVSQLKQLGFTQALVEANIALSNVFADAEMSDSAKFYNDEALRLARELGNAYQEYKALEQSAHIAQMSKHYEQSNTLLSQAYHIKDSLQDVDNRQRIEQWETIYNLRLHEVEDSSFISKWDPENVFYAMLCIIAILVCIIVILHLMKLRKDKMLMHNAEARLESEKLQGEIQNTIDQRNRELTTYTLEKLKTNEFINDISDELRQLLGDVNPRDREHKTHIQVILKKLMQFGDQDSWKEFQYYFEKVHPKFYDTLDLKYPALTSKEKRLCAFLCLDLSTKEIAAITFREVRSVESSRNRLRKKLDIPQEANLSEFIKSIAKG